MDLNRPFAVVSPTVDADVLGALAGAEASFTGRQLHRVIGRHSERGVRNALQRLAGQGIVTRTRVGASDVYALNRSHVAAPYVEGLGQLRQELIRRIVAEIASWAPPAEFAALFGSAARGDMRPDSDIDLFVVRPDATDPDDDRWSTQLAALAQNVSAWTGNDARFLELSAREVRAGIRADEAVLSDIRTEGIHLHGTRDYMKIHRHPRRRHG
jgi:predicted nucleotidyltransferase